MENKNSRKFKENVRFFDELAAEYDNPIIKKWTRRFFSPVLKEIKISRKTKILDVGFGTGEFLLLFKGKAQLYGIDASQKMFNIARKKLGKAALLKLGDVNKMPFKSNYFDYVISTEAFHHFYAQEEAVREMARVCKKSGEVIISDVNFFLRPLHFIFERTEPGCTRINSKRDMKILFEKATLKNIKQKRDFIFSLMTAGEK